MKRLFQVFGQIVVSVAVLLSCAGTFDWPWVWVYLCLGILLMLFNFRAVPREVIELRGEARDDVRGWDKAITMAAIPAVTGMLAVAGLDYRFVWTPPLPFWVQALGTVLVAAGNLLFTWAMASNRYFAAMACIQRDRGHAVQEGGPYRLVRHPGYAGYIIAVLATPLLFGSFRAFIPALAAAALFILRTYLEDRMLAAGLEGYGEYARRVRRRLVPGLW